MMVVVWKEGPDPDLACAPASSNDLPSDHHLQPLSRYDEPPGARTLFLRRNSSVRGAANTLKSLCADMVVSMPFFDDHFG